MRVVGVILLVLGVVGVLVGLFPGSLGGVENPKPGFGWQQQTAVVAGGVVFIAGLIVALTGEKKHRAKAAAGPGAVPEQPKPEGPPKSE